MLPTGIRGLCCTYSPTCSCTRFKNQGTLGVVCVPSIPAFPRQATLCEFPGQPGHHGPYVEETETVLIGRHRGTPKQTLPGRVGTVGLRCRCRFEVQRSLGESSIHRQSHWGHSVVHVFLRGSNHHHQCPQSWRLSQVLLTIQTLEIGCDLYLANQNTPSPQLVTGSGVGV